MQNYFSQRGMIRRMKGSTGYSLVLDAGLYIQEGLEDRRRQIVSLTACMYVCMDYTLKLSVMAESGRSFWKKLNYHDDLQLLFSIKTY